MQERARELPEAERWERDDLESVYVIHAPEVGRVKIGLTKHDPATRLRTLQVGSPCVLGLVRVIEGGWRKEQELHKRYAAHRVHGEWFSDAILSALMDEPDGT